MTSTPKYRKMSIIAMITMAVLWIMALVALWNSLLTSEVKNEGWVVLFMILVLFAGISLFYLAYLSTDETVAAHKIKTAYESGKNEILLEIEKKKQLEDEQRIEQEDVGAVVDSILSGIQGTRTINTLCSKLLSNLSKEIGLVQGIVYVKNNKAKTFNPVAEYAITERKPQPFTEGEGLVGQVAESRQPMVIYDIPEQYFVIASGLGSAQPRYLMISPVLFEERSLAVLELAFFKKPDRNTEKIMDKVLSDLGPKLNKLITA
jgi:hypothetical protein